jgi:hypothetical protein
MCGGRRAKKDGDSPASKYTALLHNFGKAILESEHQGIRQ